MLQRQCRRTFPRVLRCAQARRAAFLWRARRWPPSKDGLGDRPPGRTGPIIVRFTWFLARWKGLSSVCALPRDATATPTRPWGGLSVDVPPSQKLLIKKWGSPRSCPSHFHRHGPWTGKADEREGCPRAPPSRPHTIHPSPFSIDLLLHVLVLEVLVHVLVLGEGLLKRTTSRPALLHSASPPLHLLRCELERAHRDGP